MQVAARLHVSAVRSAAASSSVAALCPPALPLLAARHASTQARPSSARGGEIRMRVILREDGPLGAANSVISVRRGYARHTLLRNGLVEYATTENLQRAAIKVQAAKEATRKKQEEAKRKKEEEAKADREAKGITEAEATDAEAQSGDSAAAASPDAAASAGDASSTADDNSVHEAHVLRRLRAQSPLVLTRQAQGGREGSRLVSPIQLKEVYALLSPQHPTLSVKQLSFVRPGSSVENMDVSTFGTHQVRVQLPFLTAPLHVWLHVRKAGQLEAGRAAEVASEKAIMKAAKTAASEKASTTATATAAQ